MEIRIEMIEMENAWTMTTCEHHSNPRAIHTVRGLNGETAGLRVHITRHDVSRFEISQMQAPPCN